MEDFQEKQFKAIDNNDTLNIREEVEKYIIHWKWFLLFTVLSLTTAYLFLRYTTPQYSASTSILIKDNNKSGISAELAAFEDLGIVGGGSSNNTDNEIEILKSRKIIGSVIDSLNFDVSYFTEGRVKQVEVYKKSPINFTFIKKDSVLFFKDTLISISISNNRKFILKDGEGNVQSKGELNMPQSSLLGVFEISMNPKNTISEIFEKDVIVKITPRYKVISKYKSKLGVSVVNKNSSVINLSLNDVIIEKAEDFLNEVVKQYNIDAINDKNEVSRKTKEFIDDRIRSVGKELNLIQDRIKDYKSETGFTGVSNEGELILANLSTNNQHVFAIQTQVSLAKWVQENIKNQTNGVYELLPTNLGFENDNITNGIVTYNELISNRNRLVVNAGVKNPQLIALENEISNLKLNLKQNLQNLTSSLSVQYKQLKNEEARISSKKATIPVVERGFIDIARQQEIISGLFSYLLKKKEETAISLAVAVPNAKIIDVAYGPNKPISPKRKIVYLAALLLGLIIPFIIIYIKNLLDTKIHSRKDIEELTTLPFIGDVPHSETNDKIVIGNDSRTSTAEAFRLIRTNLDFMLPSSIRDNKEGKTIFITSTTSGEGKSFISINLAAALSLSNKKVLLLGMDLRAPKVTEYLGLSERKGITNFITNNEISLSDVKFSIPEIEGLDIISSGVIPPNPAELLLSSKIKELFAEVKKNYDYIIVDTAPVNLVTDTLLIAKYADMFMYVTRANYLDKRMLNVPQTLYNEKKLPNMAIVLNDTDMKKGYGYGYGYGYGNSYIDEVKKPWYKRF